MKLVGELKNKVEKTENLDEAKKIIEEAGMELTDDELENVAGGFGLPADSLYEGDYDDYYEASHNPSINDFPFHAR
jgi:hypothetical protein